MTIDPDLLLVPANSTALERAADRPAPDLPVPLAETLDPETTAADFLPFLASHEGVRLWFSDWPEARKREIIADWLRLASLVGTRAAAAEFLRYVDTELVDKVTHPRRFVVGRALVGITPINHRPFVAHLLLKVSIEKPARCMIVGRSAVSMAYARTPNDEPLRRARLAVVLSKAPETLISLNFGHRKPVTLDDGFDLDQGIMLGAFMDRKRL